MKFPFLFSLFTHTIVILTFVVLTQSPINESRKYIHSSNVSIVNLDSYNVMVSESPTVTEMPRIFHLDKSSELDQWVNTRATFKESSDLNFDFPHLRMTNSVEEKSDTPFLDGLDDQTFTFSKEIDLSALRSSLVNLDLDKGENSFQLSDFTTNHPKMEVFIDESEILSNVSAKVSPDNNLLKFDTRLLSETIPYSQDMEQEINSQRLSSNFSIVQTAVKPVVPVGNILEYPEKSNSGDLEGSLRNVFTELMAEIKDAHVENLSQDSLHQGQLVQMRERKSEQLSIKNTKGESKKLKLWGERIQSKIYSNLRYPYLAFLKKIGGKVTIQLKVTKEGRLKQLKILKSSGFPILDEEALRATEQARVFPSAPDSLNRSTYSFSLPIRFEI